MLSLIFRLDYSIFVLIWIVEDVVLLMFVEFFFKLLISFRYEVIFMIVFEIIENIFFSLKWWLKLVIE